MPFKFLRTAFGLGGPAATRQIGFIARTYYVLGVAAALCWLLFTYYVFLAAPQGPFGSAPEDANPAHSSETSDGLDRVRQKIRQQQAQMGWQQPRQPEDANPAHSSETSDGLDRVRQKIRQQQMQQADPSWLQPRDLSDYATPDLAAPDPPSSQTRHNRSKDFSKVFFLSGAVILYALWFVWRGAVWTFRAIVNGALTKKIMPWNSETFQAFRDEWPQLPLIAKVITVGFWAVIIYLGAHAIAWALGFLLALNGHYPVPVAWVTLGVTFLLVVLPGALYVALEALKEWDWYRDRFVLPKGPAARWGGILSFIQHDIGDFFPANATAIAYQEHSTIYLGKTFAEQDPHLRCRDVGLRTQQHMMTVALTGAGKSRDGIWNTLLTWSGGAFVFDPKGEHVQCTFARRASYRPAYVLDPYRMTPHIAETSHYNPLDEIDPDSPAAGADIVNVVQASLYIEKTEGANTAHFRENAQTVLKGFIAHVMTRYPPHRRNLPAVVDLLATGAVADSEDEDAYDIGAIKGVLEAMRRNRAVAKAPIWAMKVLDDVSPKEAGGYLSTIYRGIKWMNDPPVRRTLLWSDFKLDELKSKEISVYMVLPRSRIAEQLRWVRTLTTLAMFRCERTAQPRGSNRKVLMLLDEFPQLGTFKPIKDGLVAVRSANIKLWVVFQNIGALTELYENAHDFYSSCDQQYFGVNATDDATKEHISKALGRYLREHKEGREGETHHQENARDLLSPDAVAQFLRSEGPNQIVFPAGKALPLKLKRVPFYKNCASGTYGTVKDLGETLTHEHIEAELAGLREKGSFAGGCEILP
jgi:type IV secretory pathway TraG/TraD family ATPase VirD4